MRGSIEGLACRLDHPIGVYRFRYTHDSCSGEIPERPDPTGIGAIIREIDQRPWGEVETPDMVEPSVVVGG